MSKRKIALFLCATLIAGIFSGCGNSATKEKEKLTVMAVQLANHGDFDEMGFTKQIEEKLNIDIEWQLIQTEDIESKVSLACASGNLPDVMCILNDRMPSAVFMKYTADGTLLQLDDLIEEHGDNIKAMFENYPQMKSYSTAPDGHIYSLPQADIRSDNHERFPYKFYIRQSWLDNLNLEVPTTLEEFYQVLTAFRDDDPNGNGQQDEIPFAMPGIVDAYFGNWGLSFSWQTDLLGVDENGKVQFGYAADATRKGLTYLNRLTTQGLAEMMETENKFQSKVRSGVVGVFYGTDKYVVAGDDVGKEYTLIAPLSAEDGSTPVMSVSSCAYPNSVFITKKCENPETAMKFIDYLYSTEGSIAVDYGTEGEKLTKTEDGKYDWVDENSEVDRYTFAPGHALPYFRDDVYAASFVKRSDDEKILRELQDDELIEAIKETYLGKCEPKYELGVLLLDKQAADVEEKYYDAIKEYAVEMVNKFASGEINVETGWETYMEEINKKGLSELLAEYQRLYDAKQQ